MSMGIVAAVGGGLLVGSMMGAEAPDMSGQNQAAINNSQISADTLAFYKQVYADEAPTRARAASIATRAAEQQIESARLNDSISRDYWDYQKNTFRPLEEGIVADALAYDTPERREAEAATAVADVGMQASNARAAQTRAQTRMGVNPNSGAATSMQNVMSLGEAAAKAGAANTARKNVELLGAAKKMDAASLGRGLSSSQATSAGVAINAGNSATANASVPVAQGQSAAAMMGQGAQIAIGGNSSAGNLFGQVSQQQNAQDAAVWGALGTVAGGVVGGPMGAQIGKSIMSDKKKKKDIKPVSDEEALAAIEDTPVASWTYKEGAGDGGSHVGPMAQEVRRTMGNKAAPGGKVIDPITVQGVTMAGMAALSRKVDKLSKQVQGARA